MTIDWSIVQMAIPLLARGTVVTLQISLAAVVLACVIGFALGLAALSNVPLQDGLQVELRGRLAVYEARGELQMVVESMQRLGAGQLYEEFLRLRARLAAEGLFDAERKRPLPPFVRTVGVVIALLPTIV